VIKKIIYCVFLVLFLTDTGYSFLQHLSQPLDGDMAWTIVPANEAKPVFNSPLGMDILLKHQYYPDPNRFFSQWIFKEYFNTVPLILQKFAEPIDSVYLSCAIAKTIIQVVIIFLLAMIITGSTYIGKMDFIVAVVLITPLFQTNGYRNYMGIIDSSITYTFYYALPLGLLLIYFSPFILQFYHQKKLTSQLMIKILWVPLALVICLSGSINAGVVPVFSILVFLHCFINNYYLSNHKKFIKRVINALKMIPGSYWFYLLPINALALYSLYIGSFNISNINVSLYHIYSRLPEGIFYQFTTKLGFPVLFSILALNTIIIKIKYKSIEGKKILTLFKWIGIFAVLYILLLPFGGYRLYRLNVLRYDTIMPITLSLMFIFGLSTLFLFKNMTNWQRIWYIPIIMGVLFIYAYSDEPQFDKNKFEKIALTEISKSNESVVQLPNDYIVLSWGKILKPEDSELNAQLLLNWRITKEKRLYYNK
jgi:hypothetical protein